MKVWKLGALALSIAALAACGDDDRRPSGRDGGLDGGSGPCSEGEVVCMGREVWVCTGGELVQSEICGPEQVCALGLGCRACQPGRPFCEDNAIHICNDDGSSSTVQMECPASQACRAGA